MITKIGFWVLVLLASCAAFEMYDENRAFRIDQSGDENYNEENYDYQDLSPGPHRPEILDDPVHDLMMYKLFNSLQNRDNARLRMRYWPKFSMMENPLAGYGHTPYSELLDLKGAVAKRHLDAPGSALTLGNNWQKPVSQKQTKLKEKNIRKGPFWMCYLKMCSFRLPVAPAA